LPSVFLSHSHSDNAIARRLASDLRAAGVTVWIDEAELGVGDSLIRKIGNAIDSTDFLVVLLSPDSVASEWVLRETEVALTKEFMGRRVRVLPLLVRDCTVPPFLTDKIYADFRNAAVYQQELFKVLGTLRPNPVTGRTTIVFDESYRQAEWRGRPVVAAGYSAIAAAVADDYTVTSNGHGYASIDSLERWSILIMPMPFGVRVDHRHYETLTNWVYRGGRLVLLALYLVDGHHYNNFNHLARLFGFEFLPNLTMPASHADLQSCLYQATQFANRDYWVRTKPIAAPTSHPVVEGITTFATTSSCTINPPRIPDLLVSTADRVAIMHATGTKSEHENRIMHLDGYVLDRHASAHILVAFPYGAGRVVGIGSWKMFINELVEDKQSENLRLFRNLITWLSHTCGTQA
jgi:hypothetical protein